MQHAHEMAPLQSSWRPATPGGECPSRSKSVLLFAFLCVVLLFAATGPDTFQRRTSEAEVVASLKKNRSEHCEKKYRDKTLKTAYEKPMVGLFQDTLGEYIFEASSVTTWNNKFYVIADSSWNIFELDQALPPFSEKNWVYSPFANRTEEEGESGYEAIFHIDESLFAVVRESILQDNNDGEKEYRAVVEEVKINFDHGYYDIIRQCATEKVFEGDSKGFEGAIHARDMDGTLYVIGLCEGNYCKEGLPGMDPGHGMLVVMKREDYSDGSCLWRTVREMPIPEMAFFRDYSAITMNRARSKVAIASQEDSAVWIGDISLFDENGVETVGGGFNPQKTSLSGGVVVHFPRNGNCDMIYCNVEGLHWLNEFMMVAVSDRMKSRQDAVCFAMDQSVHVFVLPSAAVEA